MRVLWQAVVLAGVACLTGFMANLVRPHGLAFVASQGYEIYSPCPLMSSKVQAIEIDQLDGVKDKVFVDARSGKEFGKLRISGARSVPFHPLNALDPKLTDELKALGPNRIIVYGDSQFQSGELLAAELAEAGCLGVRYLVGGLEAWQAAGRQVSTGDGDP
jgi:3-mercaptopyruvate sulfurtransferase SseA